LSSHLLSRNVKVEVYKTVILPFVLYGCEMWSVALREEHRLRVFKKRVLRIFGPKRDEVTGEWRKLHSGELQDLYSSPNIIRQIKLRRMRWVGHVALLEEVRKVCMVLVGKLEGKRSLKKPRHRWEDGIRMDLRDINWGGGGVEWVQLARGRDWLQAVLNRVKNLRVLVAWSELVTLFKRNIAFIYHFFVMHQDF
jgi:hypothetical protein